MFNKTGIVVLIFVILLSTYFVYMLTNIVKTTRKKEMFAENETKEPKPYSDSQLDMNLYIINTFEDVHDRKIKTDELKKFTNMFMKGTKDKNEMRSLIEQFTDEKEPSKEQGHLADLLEIQSKLSDIIAKIQGANNASSTQATPAPEVANKPNSATTSSPSANTKETFLQRSGELGVAPFSSHAQGKYMPLNY